MKTPEGYGAPEVQLILNKIFERLPLGGPVEPLLQKIALIQLCFMMGPRIGSLVASDKRDESRLGMLQRDVSFATTMQGAWMLHLTVDHLKGYNDISDSTVVHVEMQPLREAKNILLEPAAILLTMLIHRGALRAHGPDGPLIRNEDELLASPADKFVAVGEAPLFQSNGGHLEVATACSYLSKHAHNVGLPFGADHLLRHDLSA